MVNALRVVFFGTPAFAVPTLQRLLDSRHDVVAVVTQPDKPRGRGQRVTIGPVKGLAGSRGVPVLQPDRLAQDVFESVFAALRADLGVVAAYGKLLPQWLLDTPRLGFVNVHASLLPHYRGASPIHRAVMAGDTETGVTIMRVVTALDAGAMLATIRVPIGADDTTDVVEQALGPAGADLLLETVERLAVGPIGEEPQDEARATWAPRLTKEDGRVDWLRSAAAIHNQIRGLQPWPHAYTFHDGARLILHRSRPHASRAHGVPAGTILSADEQAGLVVACGCGAIELVELQAEGARAMAARAFLAGHRVRSGELLGPA